VTVTDISLKPFHAYQPHEPREEVGETAIRDILRALGISHAYEGIVYPLSETRHDGQTGRSFRPDFVLWETRSRGLCQIELTWANKNAGCSGEYVIAKKEDKIREAYLLHGSLTMLMDYPCWVAVNARHELLRNLIDRLEFAARRNNGLYYPRGRSLALKEVR